jgi:anti-anti-sigma factor
MDQDAMVNIVRQGGRDVLHLQGTVDVFLAEEFRQAALQLIAQGEDVVVDCERVEHLDTSALQILLILQEELRGKGKRLQLGGISAPVRALLRQAGLTAALLQNETEI